MDGLTGVATNPSHQFDVIVLGAGAAGLMCAIEAGKRSRRVAMLEHNERAGKKILISGGGRCNFTNIHCRPENFLSANPHFAKSALARYTPADFIALVEKHGIRYHEKTLGQFFCDRSAHEITTMLETECRDAGVQIFCRTRVREVSHATEFVVSADNAKFRAPALVVATGGISIPKMGATGIGYDIARQFGMRIVPTRPALVPFLFSKKDMARYGDLAGVATEVVATAGDHSFREKMLFTHRGLSGPAILQASLYWRAGSQVRMDMAPEQAVVTELLEIANPTRAALRKQLRSIMPNRLADRWMELHAPVAGAPAHFSQNAAQAAKAVLSNAALHEFEAGLHEWVITPAGDEGYEKAEVTAGGVGTSELNSTTMESKKQRGLFFIGEVVDVTGQLGGYNFQWAWASGAAAGRAV